MMIVYIDEMIHMLGWDNRTMTDEQRNLLSRVQAIVELAWRREREACAKVCESKMPNPVQNWADAQIVNALRDCAAAIRARSNT